MSIATITRTTAILLAFLFNAASAQSFQEGVSAYNEGDYETAFEVFQSFATEGSAAAQLTLEFMYDQGKGVPEDDSEAVRWYRAAAEQGNATAQLNLGVMYDQGKGVPEDDSEAVDGQRLVLDHDSGAADVEHRMECLGDITEQCVVLPCDGHCSAPDRREITLTASALR